MQKIESILLHDNRALLLSNQVREFENLHIYKSVLIKRLVKLMTILIKISLEVLRLRLRDN